MKIFAGYETTDQPWGGANNFLRALYKELAEAHHAEIVFVPSEDCDVFFFGQTGKGPLKEGQYTAADIQAIASLNPSAPVIMRVVNTRKHSNHRHIISYLLNRKDREIDNNSLAAAKICDAIVFQSQYQKGFFSKQGLNPSSSAVIHNGAAKEFADFKGVLPSIDKVGSLKILATSVSTKSSKRHNAITSFASLENVDVSFAGTWPQGEDNANVNILGKLSHDEILNVAKGCHFFFHPGIKESCSNSIVEALAMGLPVLYGAGEGSSAEIVNGNGICVPLSIQQDFVNLLRDQHPSLASALQSSRENYSMRRAAGAYFDFFCSAIELKSQLLHHGPKHARHS